jgi:hypothetical protein
MYYYYYYFAIGMLGKNGVFDTPPARGDPKSLKEPYGACPATLRVVSGAAKHPMGA